MNTNQQKQSASSAISKDFPGKGTILSALVLAAALFLWWVVCKTGLFPAYALPSPEQVLGSFREELTSGSLLNDIVASLWRVFVGYYLAAFLAIPIGLWLGRHTLVRKAFLPALNFFRFLSPLAWIPFAILWFHIGDKPAFFLIFMATFFLLLLTVIAAVATIPSIYFRVAQDYNYKGIELLTRVTFPAVLPPVITALRG